MWSISFNYATNDNNCIYIAIFHHLISAEGKFETSGYCLYQDIFFFGSMFFQSFHSSVQQSTGDVSVPFGNNDTEFHFFCIRN